MRGGVAGGQVWVESNPAVAPGKRLVFRLPVQRPLDSGTENSSVGIVPAPQSASSDVCIEIGNSFQSLPPPAALDEVPSPEAAVVVPLIVDAPARGAAEQPTFIVESLDVVQPMSANPLLTRTALVGAWVLVVVGDSSWQLTIC